MLLKHNRLNSKREFKKKKKKKSGATRIPNEKDEDEKKQNRADLFQHTQCSNYLTRVFQHLVICKKITIAAVPHCDEKMEISSVQV